MSGVTPRRIQLRRTKDWRKPEGVIVVSRPTKWGNPYRVTAGNHCTYPANRADVVVAFRRALEADRDFGRNVLGFHWGDLAELRGHDLACWCALSAPCHADVLLELANR